MAVAFGAVITSLVGDVMMPPIGKLLGGVDFSNLFLVLGGGDYPTFKAAKDAGAATVNYGVFLNTVINFLIVVTIVIVQPIQRAPVTAHQHRRLTSEIAQQRLADSLAFITNSAMRRMCT